MPSMLAIRAVLAAALMPFCLQAQPKPGDIFRDYRYTSDMIVEFAASPKQQSPRALQRLSISHRERNLDIWDLEDAERAEMSLEFWGGHPGTSDQSFRVNGGGWIPIPQIQGTPTDPRCYHRMLPGTVNAAMKYLTSFMDSWLSSSPVKLSCPESKRKLNFKGSFKFNDIPTRIDGW